MYKDDLFESLLMDALTEESEQALQRELAEAEQIEIPERLKGRIADLIRHADEIADRDTDENALQPVQAELTAEQPAGIVEGDPENDGKVIRSLRSRRRKSGRTARQLASAAAAVIVLLAGSFGVRTFMTPKGSAVVMEAEAPAAAPAMAEDGAAEMAAETVAEAAAYGSVPTGGAISGAVNAAPAMVEERAAGAPAAPAETVEELAFNKQAKMDAGTEAAREELAMAAADEDSEDAAASTFAAASAAPAAMPDYEAMVTGTAYTISNVNVRQQPDTSAEILAMLEPGTEVSVITQADDEWTEILYEGGLAYINRKYLTEDPDWQAHLRTKNGYANGQKVSLNDGWRYAEFSKIHSGSAVMYTASADRKNIIIGVNAGHGTEGGTSVKTLCHPDGSAKVTGGTTSAGSTSAVAVSSGMSFNDGTPERKVTLAEARILKRKLLAAGYDVLMIREEDDVQLDNVARTVICNNAADCHIAIHWDGDGLSYDKGCFYMSVPDGIKHFDNVAAVWQESERLGNSLISGLSAAGSKIMGDGYMDMDLTQTTYSSIPSVDIELGNQSSDHSEAVLERLADGLVAGINQFYGF